MFSLFVFKKSLQESRAEYRDYRSEYRQAFADSSSLHDKLLPDFVCEEMADEKAATTKILTKKLLALCATFLEELPPPGTTLSYREGEKIQRKFNSITESFMISFKKEIPSQEERDLMVTKIESALMKKREKAAYFAFSPSASQRLFVKASEILKEAHKRLLSGAYAKPAC